MPYGRGGAGNLAYAIDAPKEAEKRRIEDPEAAHSPTPPNSTSPSSTPHSVTCTTSPMTGRGGAGNFNPTSPSTTQTDTSLPMHAQSFTQASPPQLAPQTPKAPVFQGRGGAGNIAAAAAGARERGRYEEDERRQMEERVKESVRREVDGDADSGGILKRPEEVMLAGVGGRR